MLEHKAASRDGGSRGEPLGKEGILEDLLEEAQFQIRPE